MRMAATYTSAEFADIRAKIAGLLKELGVDA